MAEVFEKPGSDFGRLLEALHLDDGAYRNPYELMTFYDNHDMARLNATDERLHRRATTGSSPRAASRSSTTAPRSRFMRGRQGARGQPQLFRPERIARARRRTRSTPRSRAIAAIRREITGAAARPAGEPRVRGRPRGVPARLRARRSEPDRARAPQQGRRARATSASTAGWTRASGAMRRAARRGGQAGRAARARGARARRARAAEARRTEDPALRAELDRAMTALAAASGG